MKLNLIRPKDKSEDSLLSITKNCETLNKQTYRKPQEVLEFKLNKSKQTFHMNPPIQIKGDWMIAKLGWEVFTSIFNTQEENNEIKLYKFPDSTSGLSYEKVKDEIEKDLENTDNTAVLPITGVSQILPIYRMIY